jgi:hypothetical protein
MATPDPEDDGTVRYLSWHFPLSREGLYQIRNLYPRKTLKSPFELAAARAARNQVDHAILHSLAAVIGNMARAIDMVAEVCLPISYYTNLDFSDIEF